MMKKLSMTLMIFAVLPLLLVGCNPPQNRHAKPAEDGTCDCGHEHGAEGHVDQASEIPESDATENAEPATAEAETTEPVVTDSDAATTPDQPAPETMEQSENEEISVTGTSSDE